jgi:hypothetical protein
MSPFLWFIWWSDLITAYAPKHTHRKPELRVIEGGRAQRDDGARMKESIPESHFALAGARGIPSKFRS